MSKRGILDSFFGMNRTGFDDIRLFAKNRDLMKLLLTNESSSIKWHLSNERIECLTKKTKYFLGIMEYNRVAHLKLSEKSNEQD